LKIGVFGIGAIGTVISLAIRDQFSIFYFNRSNRSNLALAYKDELTKKNIRLTPISNHEKLDWLLICIKEYHFSDALSNLSKLVNSDTKVAVIRNGMNLKTPLLKLTISSMILECMIDAPTQPTNNGAFQLLSFPNITVLKSDLATEFSTLFDLEKIEIKQTEDFKSAQWKKLIESSSLGAILCTTGKTSVIFRNPYYLKLYKLLVQESINVAQADGANIQDSYLEILLKKLETYGDQKGSSMLTDRIAGKPIEINAKNGAIVTIAKKLGIETPINSSMVEAIVKLT